jgi:hypothetical protein
MENYRITKDGIIEQINKDEFKYDISYVERYSQFNCKLIENLRLGYIVGTLGKVPDSLLDIGYGNGGFLSYCKNFIPKLYGYDIEPAYPLDDGIEFVNDICNQEVEVITFFDSLEHFHDIEFVGDLKCKYIVVSLPWCYNYLNDDWFLEWKHRKPNEHIYHFNEKSLELFMNRHNFKMINYCNLEDIVRKDKNLNPNILTATFIKNVY